MHSGIGTLTTRGDVAGALNTILTDPPYGEGVDEAKVSYVVWSEAGKLKGRTRQPMLF